MVLLPIRHAVPEQCCLTEMIAEAFAALANLHRIDFLGVGAERIDRIGLMHRAAIAQRVWEIRHAARIYGDTPHPVALIIAYRAGRPVDRQLSEVRSYSAQLRVEIGEQ